MSVCSSWSSLVWLALKPWLLFIIGMFILESWFAVVLVIKVGDADITMLGFMSYDFPKVEMDS